MYSVLCQCILSLPAAVIGCIILIVWGHSLSSLVSSPYSQNMHNIVHVMHLFTCTSYCRCVRLIILSVILVPYRVTYLMCFSYQQLYMHNNIHTHCMITVATSIDSCAVGESDSENP